MSDKTSPEDLAAYDLLVRRSKAILGLMNPIVVELGERFAAAGFELALVGGPVRDALLGRKTSDLDFATSANPDQTQTILAAWGDAHWDIGKEFGTIGAKRFAQDGGEDVVVEVTTYRTDEYDPKSRKPVVAFGDNLDADLSRRDFTVNAMAIALPQLEFVDPFEGLRDLAAKVLRTPIAAERSFDDDPLRMMRGARFAGQLGFDLEVSARAAIVAMAERISIVSAERVHDELNKLMLSDDPVKGLEVMVDTGLAAQVLPELPGMKEATDEHGRHKDVYQHSMIVLQQAIDLETGPDGPVPGPDLQLRLAALLHDIGKPATRRFEDNGSVSFHHHELVGAKMTSRRMRALKYDKETTKAVSRLVELHLRFHGYGEGAWTDSAVRRYVTDAGPLLERLHRLTRADCTTRNKRKAKMLSTAYDSLEERIKVLAAQEEINAIRPDLDGEAIMEILDIKPGKAVGMAYKFLMELRLDEGPLGQDEATKRLLAWWDGAGAELKDLTTYAPSGRKKNV